MHRFNEIISASKKVLICSHFSPDWDAVASALSMYDFLTKSYSDKQFDVYFSSPDPYLTFKDLKNFQKINWIVDIADVVEQYDTLIFLDGNTVSRFSHLEENIDLSKFKTICVDHHPNPPDKFDLNLSETSEASCSQLIYKLFFREHTELLDREVAEVLLLGIMGDSGTFRFIDYKKTDTLEFAKELIEFGKFDVQNLELKMSQFNAKEFELLKIYIDNTTNVDDNPAYTYTYLSIDALKQGYTLDQIKDAGAKYKMIILRQVENHNWGFVVNPDSETSLSISFRSTPGSPNVQKLANAFNGGGHVMAAGGHLELDDKIKDSIDACNLVVEYIKNNKLEMTQKF